MRAVLDPNVLVSAVLSRSGTPAALLRAWMSGSFELVVSSTLLDGLARALRYPKIARRVGATEADELVELLRARAELIDDPLGTPPVRSRDPDDDYLISLASAAPAVIVTGDQDLQALAPGIPVFSPAAFLAMLALG